METGAVAAMRAYVEAQYEYRSAHCNPKGQPVFADQLLKLKGLLPDDFIAARGPNGRPYHGYLFMEIQKFDNGVPVDPSGDFAMCATPAVYGQTGYRTFIVATNGLVMGVDFPDGRRFVDAYPVDPMATIPSWLIDPGDPEPDPMVDPKTGKYRRDFQGRIVP